MSQKLRKQTNKAMRAKLAELRRRRTDASQQPKCSVRELMRLLRS